MRCVNSLLLLLSLLPQVVQSFGTVDGAFVRGGRALSWRRVIPDGMDTSRPQPAHFYLHGDLPASTRKILDDNEFWARNWSFPRGAFAVVLVSPDTLVPYGDHRFQGGKDDSLVAAAIRTGFDGAMKIDTNQVVFHGISSGAAFLDDMLQLQKFGWGGGMLIECGAHNYRWDPIADPVWTPKFRIYVATSTDDFTYNNFYAIGEHAKYWKGMDVRWSNRGSGGHCTSDGTVKDSAFDWIYRKSVIPEPSFQAHWQGISTQNSIKALAASPQGDLWMGISSSTGSSTGSSAVWQTRDAGKTWNRIWTNTDSARCGIGGIANVGDAIVISHRKQLVVRRSNGTSFSRVVDSSSPRIVSDAAGRLWKKEATWAWSTDTGATWKSVPSDWTMPQQFATGALAPDKSNTPHFVRVRDSIVQILLPKPDLSSADSVLPPVGRILSSTNNGDTLLVTVWTGSKQEIHMRVGGIWKLLPWPNVDAEVADSKVGSVHQVAIYNGKPLLFARATYLGNSSGGWSRMAGGWWATNQEPSTFAASGQLARVLQNGYGLQIWVPSLRTSALDDGHESSQPLEARYGAPRRIGGYFSLDPEKGSWTVRWLDAAGRTRSRIVYPRGGIVPARPMGSNGIPLWMDAESAEGRWVISVAR